VLEDAIISIRLANEAALRRHNALIARRRPVELLDGWLMQVETLVERNEPVVPKPLIGEIAGFLGKEDPRLYRRLGTKKNLYAWRVLDLLFEAEEQFLPRVDQTG
jgi:hypothetical protein